MLNSRRKNYRRTLEPTVPRVHELTPPWPLYPLPPPLLTAVALLAAPHGPISPHPVTRLGPTSRKRTDQPTAASRRLFRGAEHAPPRKEKRRNICGARNRKMAANLFWVGETGVERDARGVGRGTTRACARNSYVARAKKGSVCGRGRIIGDSLFLPAD